MFCTESLRISRVFGALATILLLSAFFFPVRGEVTEAIRTNSFFSWLRLIAVNHGNLHAGEGVAEYISSLAPGSMSYYGYNGWFLMKSGDYEGAIPLYDLALEIDSDNAEYLSGRGFCFFSIGKLESAINDLTASLEIDSLRIGDYEILGRAHSENGNLNEAHYWFTRGIGLSFDPDQLSALHLHRARCYRLAGDYESAHSDLNQAIYYNPSTPYAYSGKGELYYLTMKDEDAVENFSRAIELGITDGYLADVLFQRALSYMEMEEYDAAVADMTELLSHEPGRVNAYYYRGLSYFCQGDVEHCTEDLEHFLEVGSDPRLIPEARSILRDSEILRQQW
jgi:tetratricopeptide (TPR) repeat protein